MSTLTTYPDLEQRTPEWLAVRAGIVTASTVGKLLTPTMRVADNDTSRRALATLAAERISGHVEDTPMNSDMWRGVMHEPFARDAYVDSHAVNVTEMGFMVREIGDGVKIGCSPDGLVGDDGLIEIKCPRAATHIGTVLADRVPDHYMPQVQTALLVSGREWIDFVSFCGGLPLWVKRVTPDPAWHDAITEAALTAEARITATIAAWTTAAHGLPATARVLDPQEIAI